MSPRVCAVFAVFLVVSGCAPEPTIELPLPTEAQLSNYDREVAEQLREAAARAEGTLAAGVSKSERARALGELGMLYQTYDLAALAAGAYDAAGRLDDRAWEWPYLEAVVLEMQGRAEEAERAFERSLDRRPGELAPLVRAADGRLDRNDLTAAKTLYERALEVDPRSAAALWGLGRVAMRSADWPAAEASLRRALELEPGANRIHASLAEAYRRQGDLERAAHHAGLQGLADPTLPDPLLDEVARLRRGAGALMAQAHQARAAGRMEAALAAAERAVESAPESPEARRSLASLLLEVGRPSEASEHYRAALDLEPQSAMAHYNLASSLGEDASEEALALLDRAVDLAPEVVEFRLARLARLRENGSLAEAEAGYRALLEADPRLLAAAWGRAQVAADAGAGTRALALYDEILGWEISPRDRSRIHYARGRVANANRLEDLGQSDYEAAVALAPDDMEARYALANLYGMLGHYAPAALRYSELLAVEPDHLGARLGHATALTLAGRLSEARESLENGLALHPAEPSLTAALARLRSHSEGELR